MCIRPAFLSPVTHMHADTHMHPRARTHMPQSWVTTQGQGNLCALLQPAARQKREGTKPDPPAASKLDPPVCFASASSQVGGGPSVSTMRVSRSYSEAPAMYKHRHTCQVVSGMSQGTQKSGRWELSKESLTWSDHFPTFLWWKREFNDLMDAWFQIYECE